ncbi:MAG TPA: lysylphosphatidylglycerol synthase domain-containing protein [Blastococcus sp.]
MTTVESPVPTDAKRSRTRGWRRWLAPALSVALVVAVFAWFLPQFTSLSDVWTSVRAMTWVEVAVLVAAALWNLATYQFLMMTTTPGLTFRQATVSTESTTAVSNTVVGGAAIALGLTYAMNTSWGFSRSRTSVSLLISGLWNNFAKLALPVLALVLLAFTGTPTAGRVVAGLLGVAALLAAVVALGMLLRSEAAAARIGDGAARVATAIRRPFGRGPVTGWDKATRKFRGRTILLLRARWHWITLTTLVSHLSLFLVLMLALRFVGVGADQVSIAEALAVFAFARLLTAIPFTPGGLGVIELALITGLSTAGGPRALVAAAVLIFRALTFVLPIPLGLGTYVFWRRNRSWRREPNAAPRTDLVPETVP